MFNAKDRFISQYWEVVEGHEHSFIYIDDDNKSTDYVAHDVRNGDMYIIEHHRRDNFKIEFVGVAHDLMHAMDIIETHRS